MSRWKDSLGIGASVLCAIHCAATPILIAVLPSLSITEWMASPWFHKAAAALCAALVALAIVPAFRTHRSVSILGFSTAGLICILVGAFASPDDCCSSGLCQVNESVDSLADQANKGCDFETLNGRPPGHENCVFCAFREASASRDQGYEIRAESNQPESIAATAKISALQTAGISLTNPVSSEWIKFLLLWITPVGGLLLVIAHCLNMRMALRGCRSADCGCQLASSNRPDQLIESISQAA